MSFSAANKGIPKKGTLQQDRSGYAPTQEVGSDGRLKQAAKRKQRWERNPESFRVSRAAVLRRMFSPNLIGGLDRNVKTFIGDGIDIPRAPIDTRFTLRSKLSKKRKSLDKDRINGKPSIGSRIPSKLGFQLARYARHRSQMGKRLAPHSLLLSFPAEQGSERKAESAGVFMGHNGNASVSRSAGSDLERARIQ